MRRGWRWRIGLLAGMPLLAAGLVACGGGDDGGEATPAAANATTAAAPAPAVTESKLILYVDTVYGAKGVAPENRPAVVCVQTTRVKPGENLGFRIKVKDGATGKMLDDKDIASVQLKLAGDAPLDVKFGPHGGTPPSDFFWAHFWVLPDTQPTGVLPWTVTVKSKDNRTAELKHSDTFNVASSWLTVLPK